MNGSAYLYFSCVKDKNIYAEIALSSCITKIFTNILNDTHGLNVLLSLTARWLSIKWAVVNCLAYQVLKRNSKFCFSYTYKYLRVYYSRVVILKVSKPRQFSLKYIVINIYFNKTVHYLENLTLVTYLRLVTRNF